MAKRSKSEKADEFVPRLNPSLAAAFAWLVPGSGHFVLGRRGRGAAFFVIILLCLGIGISLDGRLPWQFSNAPLTTLATFGALGSGLPCLILRLGFGYEGDMTAAGYEYGGAFILTAGLMNLLLVLDAWDIAWGKEDLVVEEDPEENS